MMRFDNIVSLPSGNTARNFRVNDLGNGRVRIQYVYTDRRRAHQVSRHFTAEFLNGRLQSITARSARGGGVEPARPHQWRLHGYHSHGCP